MSLKETLAGLLSQHGVPGAAVGVIDPDGSTRIVTAGRRNNARPVDDKTVFAAASLTKPVFAAGVMALVDAGVLDLDRPLSEYGTEPDLPDDQRAASITARMVLSHTTGFPNWRDDKPLFLRWPPGARWGYSGEGYAYLQRVVEHVTGITLDRFLAEAVLGPLGMTQSSLRWEDVNDPQIAVGHTVTQQARPRFRPPREKAAAGGLFTTAPDYLRFLTHSLTHEVRSFEPQARITEALAWGLGWGIEESTDGRAIWQWGNDAGYKNFVMGRPAERTGVVVFTNGDGGAAVHAEVVRQLIPGPHPSLERQHAPAWNTALARRPVDLKARRDEPAVRSVLKILTGEGPEEEVDRIADRHGTPDTWLLGSVVGKAWEGIGYPAGTPVACLGLARSGHLEAEITALAVVPEWRRQGFGRSLIFGA
ncbi:MAG TPA: GNAT family N-acetyltransferase, partial [Acidimicrobiales bacterium]|nr:GNAT family N-acetyltransferase [Acidimicrobiales bacterium]